MKAVLNFLRKPIFLACEIIGIVLFLGLSAMVFMLWKFSNGPVDITFAAEYVKDALVEENSETNMTFQSIVAEWPEYDGPIILGISGVKLIENNQTVLEIPQLGVQLSKLPFLIGAIEPEAIIVSNPTLKLVRTKENGLHLLVTKSTPKISDDVTNEKTADVTLKDIGNSFFKGGNLPDYPQLQPLAHLQRVSVRDARVVVDDQISGMSWQIPDVMFDLDRQEDSFDLSLSYQENREAETPKASRLSLNLVRHRDQVLMKGKIKNINFATLARMSSPVASLLDQKFIIDGEVSGVLDMDWTPEKMNISLSSEKGDLSLDRLYEAPLTFSNLSANISMDRTAQQLKISETHLDINGTTISLSGVRNMDDQGEYFPLTVTIPSLDFAQIHSLWPPTQKETALGEWMTTKLSGATVRNLELTLPINLKDLTDIPAEQIQASMSYENLKADYRTPMIPAENAKGTATLKNDILDILVESGNIAGLKIKNGRVQITHLTHPTTIGDVNIDAELTGSLSTVLDYIDKDPINLTQKIGLKPNEVKGTGDIKVAVTFPALLDLPADDVIVKVDATLNNVLLPKIVRGLDMSGGPFALKVEGGSFEISGNGMLDGRNIDVTYSEYINPQNAPYSSKIKAKLVSDEKLRQHFGVNLSEFVSGNVPLEIDYLEPTVGQVDIDITADLTPAKFFIHPLDYLKKSGVAGKATAKAIVRDHDIQSVKDIQIEITDGTSGSGEVKFGKLGKEWDVVGAKFSRVKIGKTNDFNLDLTIKEKNILDIIIKGKRFDGRPFISGRKNKELISTEESSGVAVNAILNVDKIISGEEDDRFLISPNVKIKTNKKDEVEFLNLTGKTPKGSVTASLKPNVQNRMELDITSNNAGETLYALDLYDQMVGGGLLIKAHQIKGGKINDMVGKGQITDFTIVKAPILAKLVNLFSLSGLSELLQNKGIGFTRLRTDFEWKNHKGERVIVLKNGRTSGSSIGLTFGGNINQTTSMTNLEGTAVPMSEVNSLVAKIPLLGKLLGGSSGGLIAATYTMKGSNEDPTVFINPLSVLTPGFLRSILFEGDTDFEDEPAKTSPPKKKKSYNQ
ncbi:MAG TPA: DUF3971 domain-containing protein [Alphaproteobacteria bacterium]|nr:DUF3971 domain-containing protein [Alphaproteobacteria bacterium]